MTALIISETSIRQDAEDRYCLNDLHKAAGGEKRHQPSDWLRLQQTQDLITEIEAAIPGIPGIQTKQGFGTFVCKELVYAYAMWISPAFHLKVIRAYDALVTQQPAQPQPRPAITDKASLKDCLLFAKQVEKSLRMSETSKVRMYQVIAEEHRLPSKALPVYTDETLTRALGDLLKDHGVAMTAARANQILIELGYLEEFERRASGGTTKKFKSITEAGQQYGKNETCPQNPRETQPRWYVERFADLLVEIAKTQVTKEAA